MVQIIQDPSRWASLGSALGTGLGRGLEQLADQHMKTMQQRKSASSFTQAGFNPEMSQFLSQFPPELQVKLMDQLWQRGGGQAGGLENTLNGLGQPQQQQQQRSVADTFSQPPLKEQRANEQLNIARETLAHRKSGGYISTAQSKAESAQKAIPILKDLLKLNSGGNLNQGIFGYVPFKNESSQEFEALLNQLPVEKGSATEAKLRQLANPKLAQRPEVREKILRNMLAERERDAEMGDAINQVLEQSNGFTPADLQSFAQGKNQRSSDATTNAARSLKNTVGKHRGSDIASSKC